jgi:hypothetical protein
VFGPTGQAVNRFHRRDRCLRTLWSSSLGFDGFRSRLLDRLRAFRFPSVYSRARTHAHTHALPNQPRHASLRGLDWCVQDSIGEFDRLLKMQVLARLALSASLSYHTHTHTHSLTHTHTHTHIARLAPCPPSFRVPALARSPLSVLLGFSAISALHCQPVLAHAHP